MSNIPDLMNTDVTVGMNEVVSVFVSKYEDGLFARKDTLSAMIKEAKRQCEQLDDDLIKSIDRSMYAVDVPVLNVSFSVANVKVKWDKDYESDKNTIVISVEGVDKEDGPSHGSYSKKIVQPISKHVVDAHQVLVDELERLNGEMLEVISLIKSVSRKERQIRGKISEMTLVNNGFAELLNSPEVLKLVELK
jgi:hypothetical protein